MNKDMKTFKGFLRGKFVEHCCVIEDNTSDNFENWLNNDLSLTTVIEWVDEYDVIKKQETVKDKNYYLRMSMKYGTTNLQTIDAIVKAINKQNQEIVEDIENIIQADKFDDTLKVNLIKLKLKQILNK